ncbi:hypothetical protein OESDEN_10741 [Oesophagostomum dentatum]|uniref:RanBD1 domain-containing protein n=1 Tax=Oesophagostomum dentatum TaxID=61180 RepID=A0A0B1SVU3_OESDE|nr:hypothetical protein OESDEN_10741 [Oesophagostomum dentatum]
MAADEVKPTSEQQMRTLQFNDKVSRLNREFIRQLQEWYKQCAHYDFSNSVKSYLEHMKRLDEMYSGKPTVRSGEPETPTASTSTRVIAKAKRRLDGGDKSGLNDSVKVSTPAGAPPRFSLGGDVSVIKPNLDATLTAPTPKAGESSGTSGAAAGGGGRKRAIRGGGPAGGAETVVFRGTDSTVVSSVTAPLPTTTLPKPTPGFWSSQKKDVDNNNDSDSSKPTFTFGSTKTDSSNKDQDKNFLTVPQVTFGNGKPLSFGATKEFKTADSSGSSDDKKKDEAEAPEKKKPLTFPSFSAKKDEESSEKKNTLTFNFGAKKDEEGGEKKATLTFPTSGGAKDGDKEGEKKPTLTFPTFGSTAGTNTTTSGGLQFSFGTLPKSSTEGTEEKGEYQCSVFKLVEKQYTKLGVGMLHLKEIDGKKSVLVRAATAIGTVWINALMNKTMKVAKADEKGEKLRLICPASEKEICTYVIRFPSTKEATKVREEIEEASK